MTSVLGRRRLKGRLSLYVRLQYIQDIQVNSLNGAFAATPDVPVLQAVLTLSAKSGLTDLTNSRVGFTWRT